MKMSIAVGFVFLSLIIGTVHAKTGTKPQGKGGGLVGLDTAQATVLWHNLTGQDVPEAEMLAVFHIDMGTMDEFRRRKALQQSKLKLKGMQRAPMTSRVYLIKVNQSLGEYDFSASAFRLDIPTGKIKFDVGNYSYPCQVCRGFTTDTAVYRVVVDIPENFPSIPMEEKAAEKLSSRLRESRIAEVGFYLKPTAAEGERLGMSDESPSMVTCPLIRELKFEIEKVEVALPQTAASYSGPARPRKVLKIWTPTGSALHAVAPPTPPSDPPGGSQDPAQSIAAYARHLSSGIALMNSRMFDEALEEYAQAEAIAPSRPEAPFNSGMALMYKGDTDKAIARFQESIALGANFPGPYFNLGNIYLNGKHYAGAVEALEQALKYSDNNPMIEGNLGIAYCLQGETEKGVAWRKGVKLLKHSCKRGNTNACTALAQVQKGP